MPPKKKVKRFDDVEVGSIDLEVRKSLPRAKKNLQRASSQLEGPISENEEDEYDDYQDDSATHATDVEFTRSLRDTRHWTYRKRSIFPFAEFHHSFDSVNIRTRLGVSQLLAKTSYVVNNEEGEEDEDVAESVLKACILTPEEDFNRTYATQKLQSMDAEELNNAYCRLVDEGLIEKRAGDILQMALDKRYTPRANFFDPLRLRASRIPSMLYTQANSFARMVKEKFKMQETIKLSESTDPGSMAVILEGLTDDTLEVSFKDLDVAERGYQSKGYVSRSVDRNRFDCPIILRPGKNVFRVKEPKKLSPLDEGCIWKDVNDGTMDEWWIESREGVLTAILTSPGISFPILQSVFSPVLKKKDLHCILQFLMETGVIKGSEETGYHVCSLCYTT